LLEIFSEDAEAARATAETLVVLSREHGLALYARGALASAWARAKLGEGDAGLAEFRQTLAEYARQGNKLNLPFFRGLLAEIEATGGGAEAGLTGIDGALAFAGETGEHWFDAELHRIRGEILIKQNRADPAAAEAAFLAAISVAHQQQARSFELRPALSLAKLYQSNGRRTDAYDILAPALEGFSPTPEFPAIAEAKALFEALAQTGEVKAASASLNRRLRLQVAYGNALISARGFSAPETRAAFERAKSALGRHRRRCRGVFGLLWPVGVFLCSRRTRIDEGSGERVHARHIHESAFAGGWRRAPGHRNDALVRGGIRHSPWPARTGARDIRSDPRRRFDFRLQPGFGGFRKDVSSFDALAAGRNRYRARPSR
jgi:hypothetical protein